MKEIKRSSTNGRWGVTVVKHKQGQYSHIEVMVILQDPYTGDYAWGVSKRGYLYEISRFEGPRYMFQAIQHTIKKKEEKSLKAILASGFAFIVKEEMESLKTILDTGLSIINPDCQ